jgi:hypothetical protein
VADKAPANRHSPHPITVTLLSFKGGELLTEHRSKKEAWVGVGAAWATLEGGGEAGAVVGSERAKMADHGQDKVEAASRRRRRGG